MRSGLLIFLLLLLLPVISAGGKVIPAGRDCSISYSEVMAAGAGCRALTTGGGQFDSSRFAPLGVKLSEYYDAMVTEPLHVQAVECDFLIDTAVDSLVRQFVAQDIYRHYIDSPLMGAENVAIHVFDKWFDSGLVKMHDQEEFRQAKVYADFNRQSLIGQHAPQLNLTAIDGSIVTLFSDGSVSVDGSLTGGRSLSADGSSSENGSSSGKVNAGAPMFTVLYFYDIDCAKCKLETIYLNAFLGANSYPVDFYAIYAGDDQQTWHKYMAENLSGAVHLWDPEMDSDFQRKYGVTQTPRMFLVSPDGVIVGRGLNTQALSLMLEDIFAQKNLTYGSKDSEMLFDGIFAMYDGKPGTAQVMGIADYIADKTLPSRDTVAFRQLAGDYLYYLAAHTGEGFKEGLTYHINKNIISQPAVWVSQDDSLKVVGFAQIMSELLSKAAPGTKVATLKVPGELLKARGTKKVRRTLNKLPGEENVIIFYTAGCEICAAEKAAAAALVSETRNAASDKVSDIGRSGDLSVFMVNVDDIMAADPSLASRLMETFDLSSLPYIIITDSKGVVLRRYVSL